MFITVSVFIKTVHLLVAWLPTPILVLGGIPWLVLPISQGSVCPITAWPQASSCNLPRTSLSSCFPLVCTIRWIILDLFSDLFLGGEVVVSASLSVNPGSNIFLNLVTFACFRLGLEFMFKFRTCFSISLKLVGVLGASFSISPLSARIFLFFLCILAGQWWIFLHFLPLLLLHFLQIGPSGVRALPCKFLKIKFCFHLFPPFLVEWLGCCIQWKAC